MRIARWHVEGEAYDRALSTVVEAQAALPMAAFWGTGRTASSDGQFFPAAGRGEALNLVNARYGTEPGVKAYSHVSDRFSPFATQTIPATVHEAPYILDGLLMKRDRAARPRTVRRHGRLHRPCLRRVLDPRLRVRAAYPGLAFETALRVRTHHDAPHFVGRRRVRAQRDEGARPQHQQVLRGDRAIEHQGDRRGRARPRQRQRHGAGHPEADADQHAGRDHATRQVIEPGPAMDPRALARERPQKGRREQERGHAQGGQEPVGGGQVLEKGRVLLLRRQPQDKSREHEQRRVGGLEEAIDPKQPDQGTAQPGVSRGVLRHGARRTGGAGSSRHAAGNPQGTDEGAEKPVGQERRTERRPLGQDRRRAAQAIRGRIRHPQESTPEEGHQHCTAAIEVAEAMREHLLLNGFREEGLAPVPQMPGSKPATPGGNPGVKGPGSRPKIDPGDGAEQKRSRGQKR